MNKRLLYILPVIFLLFNFNIVSSQVRLPRLISDGMILQRDIPVKIWGWASAGEKVNIQFNNLYLSTVTDNKGNWQIILPPQQAGGPFEILINASNKTTLKNVLFGDIWLCSGQSNIEYPMNRLKDRYAEAIANSKNSFIRQFKILMKYDFNTTQVDYLWGKWEEANPESILEFSAVQYFFAMDLYKKYHVPIGLFNACLGGSPAESWMSTEALKEFPEYLAEAKRCKDQSYVENILNNEKEIYRNWYNILNKNDKGLSSKPKWKESSFDASDWATMKIPCYWADEGVENVNGVMWFRKEINIPASMIGKKGKIQMGRMVDADSVFINGRFVGTTSYQYPQRKYDVPTDLLKEGKNVIIVRLINNSGKGGFVKDKPYRLFTPGDTIQLTGDWHYKLGAAMNPLKGQTFFNNKPVGLYNGMIAPSNNFAIKGVVWYQGESNTGRSGEYQKLLTSLINDWRNVRNIGDLPFILVQLPNLGEPNNEPSEGSWADFRNVQRKMLSVKNTALVVTIDLGEWNDLHPQNKLDVGRRVALAARKIAYSDKNIIASGPLYKSMKIKEKKIEITFTNCGGGLTARGGNELKYFAIAGSDKKFEWANAKIKGNKVVVWNDSIEKPLYVRYAWADNPDKANLYNVEGLPASPFQTFE